MGITFTITPEGGSGISFGTLALATARCAIECNIGSDQFDNKRFHPPGTTGNFLVRSGRTGGDIMLVARYQGAIASALAAYASDRALIQDEWCTILGDDGATYDRCNLVSMRRGKIHPQGRGTAGNVAFDATMVFTRD